MLGARGGCEWVLPGQGRSAQEGGRIDPPPRDPTVINERLGTWSSFLLKQGVLVPNSRSSTQEKHSATVRASCERGRRKARGQNCAEGTEGTEGTEGAPLSLNGPGRAVIPRYTQRGALAPGHCAGAACRRQADAVRAASSPRYG